MSIGEPDMTCVEARRLVEAYGRSLGLTIPDKLLALAHEVIE